MREHFETPEDRQNQAKIAEGVKRYMRWGLHDLSKSNAHYNLDYVATELGTRKIVALVEVKARTHKFGTYPTIMLSLGKWRDGVTLAESSELAFWLFFSFTDAVYRYKFQRKHLSNHYALPEGKGVTFEWGGRTTKQRDEADVEPIALIPTTLWERIIIPAATEREKAPFEVEEPISLVVPPGLMPIDLTGPCTCRNGCKSATCDKL